CRRHRTRGRADADMRQEGRMSNRRTRFGVLLISTFVSVALACTASAQQIRGTPGSPSAVEFPDSRVLPLPPPPFSGTIMPNAIDSTSAWPPQIMPPEGAPNILLILTDDVGFGAPSTFGGVIPTPALDRIAQNGLRYTAFHTTALFTPNAAAPLTCLN